VLAVALLDGDRSRDDVGQARGQLGAVVGQKGRAGAAGGSDGVEAGVVDGVADHVGLHLHRVGAGGEAADLAALIAVVPDAAVGAGVLEQVGGGGAVDAAALLAVGALEAVGDEDDVVAAAVDHRVAVEDAGAGPHRAGVVAQPVAHGVQRPADGGGAGAAQLLVAAEGEVLLAVDPPEQIGQVGGPRARERDQHVGRHAEAARARIVGPAADVAVVPDVGRIVVGVGAADAAVAGGGAARALVVVGRVGGHVVGAAPAHADVGPRPHLHALLGAAAGLPQLS